MKEWSLEDALGLKLSSRIIEEVDVEYELARIAGEMIQAAESSGLSQRALAKRMGHASASTVQRLVSSAEVHNATVETLVRFARACGRRLSIALVRHERLASATIERAEDLILGRQATEQQTERAAFAAQFMQVTREEGEWRGRSDRTRSPGEAGIAA